MKQALEVLECTNYHSLYILYQKIIDDFRAEIKQAEIEEEILNRMYKNFHDMRDVLQAIAFENGQYLTKTTNKKLEATLAEAHLLSHILQTASLPEVFRQKPANNRVWVECSALAKTIHYPECWDTGAYPELDDALNALAEQFKTTGCKTCTQLADHSEDDLEMVSTPHKSNRIQE